MGKTLNRMLDAEADRLCNTEKYERNGCPGWALPTQASYNGGRGYSERAHMMSLAGVSDRHSAAPYIFYRNIFSVVPARRMVEVAAMLKAIHA